MRGRLIARQAVLLAVIAVILVVAAADPWDPGHRGAALSQRSHGVLARETIRSTTPVADTSTCVCAAKELQGVPGSTADGTPTVSRLLVTIATARRVDRALVSALTDLSHMHATETLPLLERCVQDLVAHAPDLDSGTPEANEYWQVVNIILQFLPDIDPIRAGEFLASLAEAGQHDVRRRALLALAGAAPSHRCTDLLLRHLNDVDALYALSRYNDPSLSRKLADVLCDDRESPQRRIAAAISLGARKDQEAVDGLYRIGVQSLCSADTEYDAVRWTLLDQVATSPDARVRSLLPTIYAVGPARARSLALKSMLQGASPAELRGLAMTAMDDPEYEVKAVAFCAMWEKASPPERDSLRFALDRVPGAIAEQLLRSVIPTDEPASIVEDADSSH